MAADDDDRGSVPDPWDDIVADGLGEEAGDVPFQFEEAPADVPAESESSAEPAVVPPEDPAFPLADAPVAAEAPADAPADEFVEAWLSDGDEGTAMPPLAVFDPEAAAGFSDVDIGTGNSGVALHGAAEQEEIGTDVFAAEGQGGEAGGDDGAGGFPSVAGEVSSAAGATVAKPVRRAAKPAKKSGGIGQLIGVVLGGVMAIPITLAILIYGLGKDPFGITKQVPADVAFLLPEKFRPGYKKPRPADTDNAGGSALDSLPTVTEPAEPAVGTDGPTDEPAPVEPADPAAPDADMPPATDVAAVDVPGIDAPSLDPPGLDDLNARAEPAAPAEPPPLDMAALDAAVGEAAALCEALGAVDDTRNDAYAKLRTRWYRALARVAEELVAIENTAATSGRTLTDAPDSVAGLHDGIGRRERLAAELAALAPDWLAYAKRGSDGIVVPVTFESARRVGPYWAVKASLTDADGRQQDLTVISRREPAAITGDRVVVTGVAIDGAVIWAADVRAADAGGLAPGF